MLLEPGQAGQQLAQDSFNKTYMALIQTRQLVKTYGVGEQIVHALDGVSIDINEGEFVAIVGASGSGKSTFMNMIGCLDKPTSGTYHLAGEDVEAMDAVVIDQLKQLAQVSAQRPWLMVPMAVGRHVNHHAVHQIAGFAAYEFQGSQVLTVAATRAAAAALVVSMATAATWPCCTPTRPCSTTPVARPWLWPVAAPASPSTSRLTHAARMPAWICASAPQWSRPSAKRWRWCSAKPMLAARLPARWGGADA